MIKIKIYGKLAKEIGFKEIEAECNSFGDALRHLYHITDGEFTRGLVNNKRADIIYICTRNGKEAFIKAEDVIGEGEEICFSPAHSLSDPFSVGLVGTYTLGHLLVSIALSVAFALLSMLLAPSPPHIMDGGGPETKRKEAYLFDGRARTVNQGSCVPVGYGRMIVPGSVIYNRVNYVEV